MNENKLENELKELRDIRAKRAEIMRRLWNNGQPHESGKVYTMEEIGAIYGNATRQYVKNELKWLEGQQERE